MSTETIQDKLFKFYNSLLHFFSQEEANSTEAGLIVLLGGELGSRISCPALDVPRMMKVHGDREERLDVIENITEAAFEDLCERIEDPEVSKLIKDLQDLGGMPDDLFICNETGANGDEGAKLTIAVNNPTLFREFMSDPDEFTRMRGQAHFSEKSW